WHSPEMGNASSLCLNAIGDCYSLEFGGRDAFIDEFYLRSDCRGRGLGTDTLALIKTEAMALGIRALHLEVAHSNLPAQRLYERAQFKSRDQYKAMSLSLWQT
ncbi:MAG: GNAT family N-acetyltransferase, partial [Cyanobacteria bacterium]|nr:GNAT family N-acetyltransferase [Cyanobacteriota bacterium]